MNFILLSWNSNLFRLCDNTHWTSFYDVFYCRASGHRHSSRAFRLYLLLYFDFHPSPPPQPTLPYSKPKTISTHPYFFWTWKTPPFLLPSKPPLPLCLLPRGCFLTGSVLILFSNWNEEKTTSESWKRCTWFVIDNPRLYNVDLGLYNVHPGLYNAWAIILQSGGG